jgi:hypothetical protein
VLSELTRADDGQVSAQELVFGIGDRVQGWGRVVVDCEGVWLDLARVNDLVLRTGPKPRSSRSVRLVGDDCAAAPSEFGPNNAIPGHLTVTGIWLGDGIKVDGQSSAGPARADRFESAIPCPPPAGGWPVVDPDHAYEVKVGDLQTSGAAVTLGWRTAGPDQVVLVVAASDPEAVETVLHPQLGGRLCIVPSRWTRAQLEEVRDHALTHSREWGIETISELWDNNAQASIEIALNRVVTDVADWADRITDGLLTLDPYLTPTD